MPDIPLVVLAVVFLGAGGAKLAGVPLIRANFERWGLPDAARLGIGAIEVVLAVLAVLALGDDGLARVVAVAALVVMAGALATHVRAKDEPKEYPPAVLVTVAAILVLATA